MQVRTTTIIKVRLLLIVECGIFMRWMRDTIRIFIRLNTIPIPEYYAQYLLSTMLKLMPQIIRRGFQRIKSCVEIGEYSNKYGTQNLSSNRQTITSNRTQNTIFLNTERTQRHVTVTNSVSPFTAILRGNTKTNAYTMYSV